VLLNREKCVPQIRTPQVQTSRDEAPDSDKLLRRQKTKLIRSTRKAAGAKDFAGISDSI
jgi:hypothetical protein